MNRGALVWRGAKCTFFSCLPLVPPPSLAAPPADRARNQRHRRARGEPRRAWAEGLRGEGAGGGGVGGGLCVRTPLTTTCGARVSHFDDACTSSLFPLLFCTLRCSVFRRGGFRDAHSLSPSFTFSIISSRRPRRGIRMSLFPLWLIALPFPSRAPSGHSFSYSSLAPSRFPSLPLFCVILSSPLPTRVSPACPSSPFSPIPTPLPSPLPPQVTLSGVPFFSPFSVLPAFPLSTCLSPACPSSPLFPPFLPSHLSLQVTLSEVPKLGPKEGVLESVGARSPFS